MHVTTATLAVLALAVLSLVAQADAHATMTSPTPRQPESLYWFQVGCLIGCTCAGKGKEMYPTFAGYGGASALGCDAPTEPTNNDPPFRTWNVDNLSRAGDWTRYFPWRAPGHANPLDACSIASGFVAGTNSFGSSVSGFKNGDVGSALPAGKVNYWPAGKTVNVSFGMLVNHGGGYQYRLCPKSSKLSEECFQANPVAFASSSTIIRKKSSASVIVPATDLSKGTKPAGSTWRRLPFPACNCDAGYACSTNMDKQKWSVRYSASTGKTTSECPLGLQFEAPFISDGSMPDASGYFMQENRAGSSGKKGGDAASQDACSSMSSDESQCKAQAGCSFATKLGKTYCYSSNLKNRRQDSTSYLSQTGLESYRRQDSTSYLSATHGDADFSVVDTLRVPEAQGEYVLSWRWDCEQTPQIWITCADIDIRHPSDPVFSAAFTGAPQAWRVSVGAKGHVCVCT